jgi:hypothetical protein
LFVWHYFYPKKFFIIKSGAASWWVFQSSTAVATHLSNIREVHDSGIVRLPDRRGDIGRAGVLDRAVVAQVKRSCSARLAPGSFPSRSGHLSNPLRQRRSG